MYVTLPSFLVQSLGNDPFGGIEVIHYHSGKWWFWDECYLDRIGPYNTYKNACKHFYLYLKWLGADG